MRVLVGTGRYAVGTWLARASKWCGVPCRSTCVGVKTMSSYACCVFPRRGKNPSIRVSTSKYNGTGDLWPGDVGSGVRESGGSPSGGPDPPSYLLVHTRIDELFPRQGNTQRAYAHIVFTPTHVDRQGTPHTLEARASHVPTQVSLSNN